MKPSFKLPRTPSELSASVRKRLNMYSLAASAAGVSLLALAPPADAKIVYTPAHVWIGVKHLVLLDLNHDGTPDFSLYQKLLTVTFEFYWLLNVIPQQSTNEILQVNARTYNYLATALPRGIQLGPSRPFMRGERLIEGGIRSRGGVSSGRCYGRWDDVQNRYLGLKFNIKGKTHFGWARLNVKCSTLHRKVTAWLTGYAYETVPNKSIVTGQTGSVEIDGQSPSAAVSAPVQQSATLGVLALGTPGLSIWRREKSQQEL